jgi:hypothetical protein
MTIHYKDLPVKGLFKCFESINARDAIIVPLYNVYINHEIFKIEYKKILQRAKDLNSDLTESLHFDCDFKNNTNHFFWKFTFIPKQG